MNAEDHLARLLRLLQGSIRAAGFTQTEVDARIGRRRGYLSHVFQRRVDLKLADLLRVLEVLRLHPGRFFHAAVDGRTGAGLPLDNLMYLLADAGGRAGGADGWGTRAAAPTPQSEGDAELMDRVRTAVRRILDEDPEGGEGAALGSPPGLAGGGR